MRDELKMRLCMAMFLSRMKNDIFKVENTASFDDNRFAKDQPFITWTCCFLYF